MVSHRSLSAFVLILALLAGDAALCAGWFPATDLRMACCGDGQPCPMHASETRGAGSTPHETQDPANCCVASGQPDTSPVTSAAAVAASYGVAPGTDSYLVRPPTISPGLMRMRAWSPGPQVARHVLLSVFLV